MIVRVGLLAALLVAVVLAETVLFAGFTAWGQVPGLVALAVVAVGLHLGPESGTRFGFAAGVCVDLLSGGLMGLTALIMVLVGFASGVARRYLSGTTLAGQVAIGGLVAAVATAAHGLLAFLLGASQVAVVGLAEATAVTGLYSAALAPLVFRPVGAVARRAPAAVAAGPAR